MTPLSSFIRQSCLALFSLGACVSSLQADLLVHYVFDDKASEIANTGVLGAAADLETYNSSGELAKLTVQAEADFSLPAIDFRSAPNQTGPYAISREPLLLDIDSGLTITFWIRAESWRPASSIFRSTLPEGGGMDLLVNRNGQLMGIGAKSPAHAYEGAVGSWMFVAITWDGNSQHSSGGVTFYRGENVAESKVEVVGTASYSGPIANSRSKFVLGNTNAPTKDRPLDGLLADFRIYNNVLDRAGIEEVRRSVFCAPHAN